MISRQLKEQFSGEYHLGQQTAQAKKVYFQVKAIDIPDGVLDKELEIK